MAMKLSLSQHAILESASLALALVALVSSGVTLWHFREHLHRSEDQFDSINNQIGNTDSSSLVHQEDFQRVQSRIDSLDNGVLETKQKLEVLQEDVAESQKSIQSLQTEIDVYKTQISALEADKAVLASCIENINPVAAQMSVIPASLSNGPGWSQWLNRSIGAWDALEAVQTFNVLWNSESGKCEAARSLALN